MTTTITAEPAASISRNRSAALVAALCSLLFAVALFWTVASVNVPHDATDADLLTWWQESGHRLAGLVSAGFAVAAAVLFTIVLNHLRSLHPAAAAPAWSAFAHSMGTAFAGTLLVTAALRGVVGFMVDVRDEALPGPELLRYSTDLNYLLMGVPVMTALALCMVGVSVVVLRTGALGRWVGYVGIGGAIVILGAVVAMVGAFAIPAALLWAICLAVAIHREG